MDLKDTELLSQGATLVSLLEEVGFSAGRLGDLPAKTKMCCANPAANRDWPRVGLARGVQGSGFPPWTPCNKPVQRGQGLSSAVVKLQ